MEAENRRLEVVLATQRKITSQGFNLEASLDLVARGAQELSYADGATVELVEDDELIIRATTGLVTPYQNTRYKVATSIAGQSYFNNKIFYSEDTETDERVDRLCYQTLGIRSLLIAPLTESDNAAGGILKVVSHKVAAFNDEAIQALQLLAGITGMAIRQDREAQATRELAAELVRYIRMKEEMQVALESEKERRLNISQFISLISHDFRTPLTAIQSSTELLQYYSDRFSVEKKAEIYERVHSSVRHLTEMLDNIALIGKARVDRIPFLPEPISPRDLCKSLVSELEPTSTPKEHRLVYTGPVENNYYLLDKNLTRLILWHLLNNALKYSPEDAPVELRLDILPEALVFTVTDRGIGIPAQEQSRIFEIFFRGSNAANMRGSGMGLAIVRYCLELHGGSISLSSEVGHGTTFQVSLPVT